MLLQGGFALVKKVRAIYDDGVLRLLEDVDLPSDCELTVVIMDDDVPAEAIQELACAGGAFDFLADPAEDVYTADDGEPV